MQFQDTNAEIILGFLMIFFLFTLVDPIFYFSLSRVRYLPSCSYYFFTFVGDNTMLCKHSYTGTLVPPDALASNLMH
jgi:hypothetical protein